MRVVQGQWVAYCYADGDAYADGLTSEAFKDWKEYYGKLQCVRQLYITGWECYAPNYHSYVYGTTDYTYYGFATREIEIIDGVVSIPMYSNDFTYNKSDTNKDLGVPVFDDSGNQLYYSLTRDGDGLINVFSGFQKLEDDAIILESEKITFGYQWGYFAQEKPEGAIEITSPYIGMTKTEAENSTWGKPENINTTTTANGTHEQWVYSGNRYLYFDNGILTAIQDQE